MKILQAVFTFMFPFVMFGQTVFVTTNSLNSLNPTFYELFYCNLNNIGELSEVYLEVFVKKDGETILAARTGNFTLEQGITSINTFNAQSMFSSVTDISSVSENIYDQIVSTGYIPSGNYVFCIYVFSPIGELLSHEACNSFMSWPISPPRLLLPEHDVEIHTSSPLFSWTHAMPYSNEIIYQLEIVQLFEGQSSYEAFITNPIFHKSIESNLNIYQYPISGMEFIHCHYYAWRLSGGLFEDNPSEIREFLYSCEEESILEEEERFSSTESYFRTTRDLSNEIIIVNSNFNILLENTYSDIKLDYSILDNDLIDLAANNSLTNLISHDEILSNGTNVFIVNIELLGLIPGKIYVLRINNLKRLQYLKFKYEEI